MKNIKMIIFVIFVVFLSSCNKKTYVILNYNCKDSKQFKCELKNKKINCKIETPTCDGYTFLGWYDDQDNKIDLSTNINDGTIIYAKWKKISKPIIKKPLPIIIDPPIPKEEPY